MSYNPMAQHNEGFAKATEHLEALPFVDKAAFEVGYLQANGETFYLNWKAWRTRHNRA